MHGRPADNYDDYVERTERATVAAGGGDETGAIINCARRELNARCMASVNVL